MIELNGNMDKEMTCTVVVVVEEDCNNNSFPLSKDRRLFMEEEKMMKNLRLKSMVVVQAVQQLLVYSKQISGRNAREEENR